MLMLGACTYWCNMKILHYTLSWCALSLLALPAMALDMPKKLPSFAAEDLNERPIALPESSPSKLTFYIFAYQREQQSEVDAALEAIQPLFDAYEPHQFDYIEVPTIENYGALFRWFVDNGMRSGITETETRARVVTYYTDMSDFQERYGVNDLTTITSVLADRNGNVYWSNVGAISPEQVGQLQRKVVGLLQETSGKQAASAL